MTMRLSAIRSNLSRRELVLAGVSALLGLAGCGPAQVPRPSAARLILNVPVFANGPGPYSELSLAYSRVRPTVEITWSGLSSLGAWGIALVAPGDSVSTYQPLDLSSSLGTSDFNLLPGLLHVFRATGTLTALPVSLTPTAIRYNPRALESVGVSPTPNWTIADFEDGCARVAAGMEFGRLQGVTSVLPLLLGEWSIPARQGAPQLGLAGELSSVPGRWSAIVQGFGGWLYRGGAFSLTNAGALSAFMKMIEWQRLYGANPYQKFASVAQMNAFRVATAVGFGPDPLDPADARYAPFPHLPQASPIPIAVSGVGILRQGPAIQVPADHIDALVAFVEWLYAPEQQRVLASGGLSPLIADGALQETYWSTESSPPGLVPSQGWKRFTPPFANLPPGAPWGLVGPVLGKYANPTLGAR